MSDELRAIWTIPSGGYPTINHGPRRAVTGARVVTIDFWNTLYFQAGTAATRSAAETRRLAAALELHGFGHKKEIADRFLAFVDGHIKSVWERGYVPTVENALDEAGEEFGVSRQLVRILLHELYDLYVTDLKPEPAEGAPEFLRWVSSRWPLYLISDTFTLSGSVLDRVLRRDGLFDLFRGRYYSDEVGCKKIDPQAMRAVIERENVRPSQIVHIGDLPESDGVLAERVGCRFILLGRDREASRDEERTYRTFADVTAALVNTGTGC